MSAEYYSPDYSGEDFEPASEEELSLLTALAERALEQGERVTETGYGLHCAYGQITLRTKTSYDEPEPYVRHVVSVYGRDSDSDDEGLLLEYSYHDDDGRLADEYIAGTGSDDNPLRLYAALVDIADICREIELEEPLDKHERRVLGFIKQTVRALHAEEPLGKIDEGSIGKAIAAAVRESDTATSVTVSHFSAQVEGQGVIGITGYQAHHDNEQTMVYPRVVVEFEEMAEQVATRFVVPINGNGPYELFSYELAEGGFADDDDEEDDEDELYDEFEAEDDEDRTPNKQGVAMLTGHLSGILADDFLLELQYETASSLETDDELYDTLSAATTLHRLYLDAPSDTEEERSYLEQFTAMLERHTALFETRYHLRHQPIRGGLSLAEIANPIGVVEAAQLLKQNGLNTLTIKAPYIWTIVEAAEDEAGYQEEEQGSGTETETKAPRLKPLIIALDDDETVEVVYTHLSAGLLEDEYGNPLYGGLTMFGYFFINNPLINNPGAGVTGSQTMYYGLVPHAESPIVNFTPTNN